MRIPFITKKRVQETGYENAQRFCDLVEKLAMEHRIIAMYPHPGYRSINDEGRYGWVWMANEQWRKMVGQCLYERKVSLKSAEFHAPDSIEGWCFTAISNAPAPRVALLSLEDSL